MPNDDVLERLATARHTLESQIRQGEDVIAEVIHQARAGGHTWEEIAQVLGVTRSAAWQRWHTRVEGEHQPPTP